MTKKYIITGLAQGIGFRPDVKRAAEKHGVRGYVKNLGGVVEIAAEGDRVSEFISEVKSLPQAVITSCAEEDIPRADFTEFTIAPSGEENKTLPLLTPDIATCQGCIDEFYDSRNRRFKHPFISCVRCGPRYSIQQSLPYDRESITMTDFEMCGECEKEYRDINDIRCHAQTIACNSCGPVLSYTVGGDPLDGAVNTLRSGGIVAVKDIGGYHFACRADNENAAKRLREIKQRTAKPFAVMFHSLDEISEYAEVNEIEKRTLLSAARPIVLLRKKKDLALSVCGGSDYIGAFLPCNPVQDYLTKMCGALVMTSANVSGEPIITENGDIIRLRENVGGFEVLSHNRRILTPLDDSVCRVICGRVQMIRRARGYVPLPITIDAGSDKSVLALGGDLKATFCCAKGGAAYMSQYFGDLENDDAYRAWKSNIPRLSRLLNFTPDVTVKDAHPMYLSAGEAEGETLLHHFAHMASVMAEHRLNGTAVGFVFDGTGYGGDGNVWGGEVIRYDGGFTRIASLEYTALTGGDESARDARTTLDCYLISAGLDPVSENGAVIKAAVENNINTVKSSSMGRLFDAVSAMLGIRAYNSYEGECAIMLESAARKAIEPYPLTLPMVDGRWQTSSLICGIHGAVKSGADIGSLALGFHHAVANAVMDFAANQNEKNIILSGGVFANGIFTELCVNGLAERGFNVYINEQVPTNDGGIALGQAWYVLNKER